MNKQRILVIDDEEQMQKLLRIALEHEGYQVLCASNLQMGTSLLLSHHPDLVLLDLQLPDGNGIQMLEEKAAILTMPVIVISANEDESSIIKALDLQARDYITKPFRTGELMARIRSAFREKSIAPSHVEFIFGPCRFDFEKMQCLRDNEAVKLTSTELKLLQLFIQNEGRVLTHPYLLQKIWGNGSQEETQYLRVYVGNLRKKLEIDPQHPRHFLTESGIGYRFIAE